MVVKKVKISQISFCNVLGQDLQRSHDGLDHFHIPETDQKRGHDLDQKNEEGHIDPGQGQEVEDQGLEVEGQDQEVEGQDLEVAGPDQEVEGQGLEVGDQGQEEGGLGPKVKAQIGFGEVNMETLMHTDF